jgi:3-methyladenine DNA glycosylase AlkD
VPWIAWPAGFDGGIRNWAHTDILCGKGLTPILQTHVVEIGYLRGWLVSPHKFQRRALPVALIPLLGDSWELQALFDLVEPLMMDSEKPVQGTGWFLREAWKRYGNPTEKLLTRHKDRAPQVIYQPIYHRKDHRSAEGAIPQKATLR